MSTESPVEQSPISDPLRRVIVESGIPYKTLEAETGVTRASIMRFVRGDQSLRLDIADRLARRFGLSLSTTRPPRKGKINP